MGYVQSSYDTSTSESVAESKTKTPARFDCIVKGHWKNSLWHNGAHRVYMQQSIQASR